MPKVVHCQSLVGCHIFWLWLVMELGSVPQTALVPVVAALSNNDKKPPITYRPGQTRDAWSIGLSRLRNFQTNPFQKIQPSNLLVAYIHTNPKDEEDIVVGWVEIQPLGSTHQRSSKDYNARPGSYDMEGDVDDQMWDEFMEDDSIQVPTGWASLPWTKEYRAMEAGIVQRQNRRSLLLQEAERQQKESQVPIWQLGSLFVEPYYRGQGIGSELVRRICDEYKGNGKKRLSDLYVITRHPTFFGPLGFEPIRSPSDTPLTLKVSDNETCLRGTDGD